MRLFDIIKIFAFNETCRVYATDNDEEAQFEGFVTDIPYWLLCLNLIEDGGIGVDDGVLYFIVEV